MARSKCFSCFLFSLATHSNTHHQGEASAAAPAADSSAPPSHLVPSRDTLGFQLTAATNFTLSVWLISRTCGADLADTKHSSAVSALRQRAAEHRREPASAHRGELPVACDAVLAMCIYTHDNLPTTAPGTVLYSITQTAKVLHRYNEAVSVVLRHLWACFRPAPKSAQVVDKVLLAPSRVCTPDDRNRV